MVLETPNQPGYDNDQHHCCLLFILKCYFFVETLRDICGETVVELCSK